MHTENFLHHPETIQQNPNTAPRRKRRWKRVVVLVVCLAFFLATALTVVAGGRIVSALGETKDAASRAEAHVRAGDFLGADADLTSAGEAIARAKSGVRLIGFLRPIPWVGTQLRGLSYTLNAGGETLAAMHEAVMIAAEVSTVVTNAQELVGITNGEHTPYGELSTSARVALLNSLHDAYPSLLTMQVKLGLAQEDLKTLSSLQVMPAMERAIAPFAELITPLAEAVDLLTPFSAALPELAGLGEDKQHLLLFANNTELRPGGGFLGVYALAITRDGEIVNLNAEDTYSIDSLVEGEGYQSVPPAPLTRYLGSQKWYFRDSNWSPDFPTSVKDSTQLLRQEIAFAGNPVPEVHGALMLTPTFIGRLLELIGPVTIDGQTFTAQNVADKLEYEVELGYALDGLPPHQRKDVVARLTDAVVDRLLAMPTSQWPQLFTVLGGGFEKKELALWSADSTVQDIYTDADWSGTVRAAGADDVVMVVDANLGALKTDPEVDREIAYTVNKMTDGTYQATTAITYTNDALFTWKTTRYRTYTRIYAPLGSTLISSEGTLDNDRLLNPSGAPGEVTTTDDLGMTSFGAFTAIEPGMTRTLKFTYRLPDSVAQAIEKGIYELKLIKQLGAATHDLALDLNFGRAVTYASPGEDESEWGDQAYRIETVLDTDKTFTLRVAR